MRRQEKMAMHTPARWALRLALGLAVLVCTGAQAQSAAETALRDQLRKTILDLRQLQDENAGLKAKLAAAAPQPAAPVAPAAPAPERKPEAGDAKLQGALKSEKDHGKALQRQLDNANKVLAQWQQVYDQAVALARGRDAEAKKFEGLYHQVDDHVNACDRKNTILVQIGEELIERYKEKDTWEALKDGEPLTGIHHVKLERIAQEYHARIVDATSAPLPAEVHPQ
jgi:hypothetical protein